MRKIKTWIKFNESVLDNYEMADAWGSIDSEKNKEYRDQFFKGTRIPELEKYVVFSYSTNKENLIIGKIVDILWKQINVKVIESISNTEEHKGFFPKIEKNDIAEIETDNEKFNLLFTSDVLIDSYHKFKELKKEFVLDQDTKKYNL